MIDYRSWQPPAVSQYVRETQPAVLTVKQRRAFWAIAAGKSMAIAAHDCDICLNTLKCYRRAIRERIPGLRTRAHYGALAAEIIQRLAAGVFSETAAASALVEVSNSVDRAVSAAGSPAAMASSSAALKPLINTIAD